MRGVHFKPIFAPNALLRKAKPMEEATGQLNSKQAGRLLGITERTVRDLVYDGRLPRYGTRRKYWHRIEDVEAIAREPHRVLRNLNWERKTAKRQTPPAETPPDRVMVDSRAAQKILGVCEKTLLAFVHSGQLLSYQKTPKVTPHRFLRADVEALRDQRESQKKAPRPPQEESLRPRYITRQRLNCKRRIEVGDLPEQEKYFPDWINARQAAWLLHTTLQQVYKHRDRGQIRAVKDTALASRNCRWLFCKEDVLSLMNDLVYNKGRFHYAQYCTPEAIARNKAKREQEAEARFREQLDACIDAMHRSRATRGSQFAANPPE